MLTSSLRIVLQDLLISLLSESAYRRQLLPSVGVVVSIAAEAGSSIKVACVYMSRRVRDLHCHGAWVVLVQVQEDEDQVHEDGPVTQEILSVVGLHCGLTC